MKKLLFLSFTLLFLFVPNFLYAQVIWQEDFDGFSSNWLLSNDNDGRPNCPAGFEQCGGDQSTSNSPDIEIHTDFERSNRGGNNRAYRVWIYPGTSPTCCENILRKDIPAVTDFYLRWYMRLSTNSMGNYWKMFRFWDTRGTHRFILEPKYRHTWGETRFIITTTTGEESAWTNWIMSDDYTANRWVCMEVYVNQSNNEATLWVDGDNKGTIHLPWSANYNVGRIGVGGNQTSASGKVQTMDYDDIVVSTTYVGPNSGVTAQIPSGLHLE